MRSQITTAQIDTYRSDGFVVIEDFVDDDELEIWRSALTDAVANRRGKRFHDDTVMSDEFRANEQSEFYDRVFDQLVNLWQTDQAMRELILDPRIGRMAAELAGVDGVRVWHDQALIKRPYANPTAFHLDVPYWSFTSRDAISIWIALDDATEANGCLYFFPGSHRETTTDNVKIGQNVGAIFDVYPQFADRPAASGAMKAGSCSFHSALTIHGAGANMTNGLRRAMTCAFMPDGSVFNGQQNILTDAQLAALRVGDPLDDPAQNPLVYAKTSP
jgi:phytanoyl-CoA hydroxylase